MTNKIQITVSGTVGVGKTSVAWLLADFLQHTGFEVEINSPDLAGLEEEQFNKLVFSMPDRLERVIEKGTIISINEVQTIREGL